MPISSGSASRRRPPARVRAHLLTALATAFLVASCVDSDAVRSTQPLDDGDGEVVVVGVDPEFAPYSFLEDDGSLRGMVVDLVQEVATIQEMRLSFRTAPTAQLRRALRRGEIDVVPHWPQTAEPPDGILVSLAHFDVPDGVFVRISDDPSQPKGSTPLGELLQNHTAVVQDEDPAYEFVAERVPVEQILVEPSTAAALRRLAGGDGDYALVPRRTGTYLLRSLDLDNLSQLPTKLAYTRGLSFAVRDDRKELMEEFERGMVILTENGTYERIFNQWVQFPADEGPDLRWLLGVLGATIFLLGLSTVWSWSLRRTVARRTAELRAEEAERRRLEAQIQQTQKLESLGILAGGVAHDFNNLLMGILGNVSLARHGEPGAKLEERLEEIERAGREAAELTGQMLAYSGRGSFSVQRLDLSSLVQDLMPWISAHVSPDARIALDLAEELPQVEGDEDQLRQLIQNLVTNASEALEDDDGLIRLATSSRNCDAEQLAETYLHPRLPAGPYVVLHVSDSGQGMEPDVLERVFDPFFSTKFTGRGLGLAATLGIVRGHRGAIQIHSTPGEGTRVRVFLPTAADAPSAEYPRLDLSAESVPETEREEEPVTAG